MPTRTTITRRKPSQYRSRQLVPLRNNGEPKTFTVPKERPKAKRDGRTFGTTVVEQDGGKLLIADYCSGLCSRCGVYGMVGSVTARPETRTCKDGCKGSDLARALRRAERAKDRKKTAKKLKPVTKVDPETGEQTTLTTGYRVRAERAERRWQARAEHVRNVLSAR